MVMENILAMKELERGHEYANQLQQSILNKPNNIGDDDDGEDEDEVLTTSYGPDIAAKVEDSLRNAIFLLNNHHSSVPTASPPNSDERHERCSKSISHTIKEPRRRFSPRKRKSIETWEEYSKIGPKEDGYAWRKYGEKIILNSKYPRCYLRCSNKYEQGCEATKQVQIIQDDPPLYRTTYFGHHTCTKPQMFLDYYHNDLPSSTTTRFMISFDNNKNTTFDQHNNHNATFLNKPNHPIFLSSSFPRRVRNLEKYCKNMEQENIINDYVPSSSSNGEVLPFESGDLMDVISSAGFYDRYAVFNNNYPFQI